MPRYCCFATVRMARSTLSTGAATAISGGSIPPSKRQAAAHGLTRCRPRSSRRAARRGADERSGAGDRGSDRGAELMEIADLLIPRGVIAQLRVSNKKQALQEI